MSYHGLAVVGRCKLTGNQALQGFYLRIPSSGQVAFIVGFEDSNFVYLFRICEYKPRRLHWAVEKQQEDEGTEP